MDSGELMAVLEDAGLSPYQADAYVTLLDLGSASAGELADASGVPRPRIYDILGSLEEAGYVVTFEEDRLYARANDPEAALAGIRSRIDRFDSAVEEIETRWREPESSTSDVSIVKRFGTVFQRARKDIADADVHVQVAATLDQVEALSADLLDAKARGVYVQVTLQIGDDTEAFDRADFEAMCDEIRYHDRDEPFVVLTDRRRVAYSPHARTEQEYGVLVDDRVTAYVFHWFYLTVLWEACEPLFAYDDGEPPLTFVEIRDCIRIVEQYLDDGATVYATVEGYDSRTGFHRTLEGRIVDIDYAKKATSDGVAPIADLAGRASLTLETDDSVRTVGGQGASEEEIAADRVVVEAVEYPEE